jgi:REP element-mobilizing transposase RayT
MSDPHACHDRAPLAYFITFRAYGTWLHGDPRGSVDRFRNTYGSPRISPDLRWQRYNDRIQKSPTVKLDSRRRTAINDAIQETCDLRKWKLWTKNVRTNHVHVVVSASCDPEIALRALKSNATRKMREAGCWHSSETPWARKGSKRWLWTHEQLKSAMKYVKDGQGEPL